VRETGARARRNGVMVFVARATPTGRSGRVGITVPGGVGPAVVRNRLRRRLRAAFDSLEMGADRDVVVRGDQTAAGATFRELEDHLKMALTRANEALEP
jgi:ribonuclease P protein component